jgi:hypothetical protein
MGILASKPGTSDGSENQLIAWEKLATYFKLKSPDSNSVPGVTQSFAAFRTFKDRIPVFLRVPSASTGIFLCIVDTEIY